MNGQTGQLIAVLVAFAIVALASKQIGAAFARFHLPLISGFLFTGILVGPFVLGLIPHGAPEQLRIIDETSLAIIAFAAGSELYLRELRDRFRSIAWVSILNTLLIPIVGGATVVLLADHIPFLNGMNTAERTAIALVISAILVARSPSSAIAIVNEMRAKGPFTQTVLGVTMITDVVVIIIFAVNSSAAHAVLNQLPFDLAFIELLAAELVLAAFAGLAIGFLLRAVLSQRFGNVFKIAFLLFTGMGVFLLAYGLRDWTHTHLAFEIFMEPLLVCMVASFYVTNFTGYRLELQNVLAEVTPAIYIIFFTLVGAGLALDVLVQLWPVALALFAARVASIAVASFAGGVIAGDPMQHNRIGWMTYLTQAGVGLGLAKEAAVEYPGWGEGAAAMVIAVIVLSQIIGPPFFKWAINAVGETHMRAAMPSYEGGHTAIILGLEGQSVALARLLFDAGWSVRIGTRRIEEGIDLHDLEVEIQSFDSISESCLHNLGAENADTIISMLDDEENYRVCELAYERFGTEHVIVRLNNHRNYAGFKELGAIVLFPSTAIISLLAHFARAPSATSLLLGERTDQDVADMHMRNPVLDGLTLRDIRLPVDVLVLSVERGGDALVSHGYTRLKLGDVVTVVGSPASLDRVELLFSA
ncbi:MAG: monovalent cation:proton antiporter family protein [Caldilineaceae bacterium]